MNKRRTKIQNPKSRIRITPIYIFFYILFSPDTYRVLLGVVAALILGPPVIQTKPVSAAGEFVIYLMLATIGYAITGKIGGIIAETAKNAVLKDKR